MLRLNRLTDYAVVVMTQMTHARDQVRTAPLIAQSTGVPLPTVSKLLNALARGGLVKSLRGAAGGYSLARPPGEISVAAIIQALEGPISLTACVHGSEDHCDVESLCPMRGNWDKVNLAIRTALETLSLADMAQPADPFLTDLKPRDLPRPGQGLGEAKEKAANQ